MQWCENEIYKRTRFNLVLFVFLIIMVLGIGFEPMIEDSESSALPLGEPRIKKNKKLFFW